ncbi:unnamed protein product [Phytophthora lilii]|uniref:Unnamed protein product n=1 Tax=Phytophthora lilii TaxID=2077276 RepID=A0A9W6X0P0_9STRA|nr:unnamed protein product [Phytophthora lilii]
MTGLPRCRGQRPPPLTMTVCWSKELQRIKNSGRQREAACVKVTHQAQGSADTAGTRTSPFAGGMAWRDRRLIQRLKLRVPLLQAPMAGTQTSELAVAVARGGGLGAIPCALLSPDAVREHVQRFRAATQHSASINLNFFCHTLPPANPTADKQWQDLLAPYYREYGVDEAKLTEKGALRMPFDETSIELVQELKPEVVSFHFGLPAPHMLQGVKDTGAIVFSTATTVREAVWLEEHGCDAVIAQGIEAGGHRGVFLPREGASCDGVQYRNSSIDFPRQTGTMSLVPQIVDAVGIPVIATGGIGDARGVLAASCLGAAAVQMGTVFLLADEVKTSALHRKMLKLAAAASGDEAVETAITNILSGRPARGFVTRVMRELGPISAAAPEFPTAGAPLAALKKAAEAEGDTAFSSLWSGQSPAFAQEKSGEFIVRTIIDELDKLIANTNNRHSSL